MNLNSYRDEAADFLKSIGFEDTELDGILDMLEEEFDNLKKAVNSPGRFRHQIYDMLFLLFEMAARYQFDLEEEWNKGRKRKYEKYISKTQAEKNEAPAQI